MAATPAPAPFTPTPADFDTRYGVPIEWVGEEGHLLAFGHHPERRVIAAAHAMGRIYDPGCTKAWSVAVEHRWALFHRDSHGWNYHLVPGGTPGATAVTWIDTDAPTPDPARQAEWEQAAEVVRAVLGAVRVIRETCTAREVAR